MNGAATATRRSVAKADGTSERAVDGTVGGQRDDRIAGSAAALRKSWASGTNVRRLRLQPRKRTGGSVVLSVDGRYTVAEFVNLSVSGAGLHTQVPLHAGKGVTLHFEDGRVVEGTVCWTESSRAGIEFVQAAARPPPARSSKTMGSGILAGLWRQLTGDVPPRTPSQRLIERACRANGMGWLVCEEADQELGRSVDRKEAEFSLHPDENTK